MLMAPPEGVQPPGKCGLFSFLNRAQKHNVCVVNISHLERLLVCKKKKKNENKNTPLKIHRRHPSAEEPVERAWLYVQSDLSNKRRRYRRIDLPGRKIVPSALIEGLTPAGLHFLSHMDRLGQSGSRNRRTPGVL